MTFAAMLRKETLLLLRSPRAVVLLYLYFAVLAAVVLWSWPIDNVLVMAALASRRLIYVVGVGQLLMLLAILPGLTAGSIVRERETGCLELLQASRLDTIVILLGKWLGNSLYAGILLICSLPLVALCQLLGTLDWRLVGMIYAHLVFSALWAAMVGLGVSSVARTSYGAQMGSYAIVIAVTALPVAPSFLFATSWAAVLRSASPLGSMVTLIEPKVWLLLTGNAATVPSFLIHGIFCGLMGGLALFISWWQVRKPHHTRARRMDRLFDTSREMLRRKLRFPFYLIDPQRRRRHIGNWINPVFARELRSRMLGQGTNFVRVFYAVLIFSLLVTIYSVFRTDAEIVDSVRVVVIASQVLLIGLLTPPLTSSAVSRERELKTLDLLRLTRIGPWRLVMGKWYYSLVISLCILVAALPMWLVLFELQRIPAQSLVRAIYVILASLLCGTTAGLVASSLVQRTGAATGIAYLLALAFLFGTLLPVVLTGTAISPTQAQLLSVNPIVAAIHAVSLGLFQTLLEPHAWRDAVTFLVTLSGIFLGAAVLRTWSLYRSR
jgi:ABC-type transport system involved in multi-copper enzyme maturation permease subunit